MAKRRWACAGTRASSGRAILAATGLPARFSNVTRTGGAFTGSSRTLRIDPVTASTGRPPTKAGSTCTCSSTRPPPSTARPRPA